MNMNFFFYFKLNRLLILLFFLLSSFFFLLSSFFLTNIRNILCFPKASEGGFEDVCSVLIQNGAIIDDLAVSNKDSALILASKSGHANVVHLLLEANADVHVKNAYGNTPLHAACTEGYVEVANALIDAGSNIAAVNNKGSTCLHLFCLGDNEKEYPLDMLKMLIKSGGSDVINAKDSRGVTPLIAACGSGREDVCAYLLDHGANGNDIDNSGMTGVDTAKFQSKKLSSKILDQMARK